ncbi:hypothetical protein [Haloarcula marina]|uniref:hypothetical protein n=1 Tax=Haloarcula marina TaxID=2961574 RepID=UPI0020B8D230|nr:hypothetical protein [Halomicroarcula marina]
MDYSRAAVLGVAIVVLVTAAVSGPLVPGVTLTTERSVAYGEGTANVSSATLPDRATLERGSFGQRGYYLTVPPGTVQFDALTGTPMLVYRLNIDDIGYTRSTVHFLDASVAERYEVTMDADNFAPERIDRQTYRGTIGVVVEDSRSRRLVAERNLTVEVDE